MTILDKYGLGGFAAVYSSAIEVDIHEKLDGDNMYGEFLLEELERRIIQRQLTEQRTGDEVI